MTVTIIVAIARGGAIGRKGDLLFHLSPDLRHFKAATMGHPMVMGRKTFESFPNGPLPGRRNIIVSRTMQGTDIYPSLDMALAAAGDEEVMVIGGGQIYHQAIALASKLIVTEIDAIAEDADTYFPEIDMLRWEITDATDWTLDPKSGLKYRFVTYELREDL